MINHKFIFLAGLHRSGTSLLHEIIRGHPQISGFKGTGVPEDEGQHLQSVYKAARHYGGPGKFALNKDAYMDENHSLATKENSSKLFLQWSKYCDSTKKYIIEKSPPNIIRTRFLQKIFPNSKFIIILRHPISVAYATQKMCKGCSIEELIGHSLEAYRILYEDIKKLKSYYLIKYEDFIMNPQEEIDKIFAYLQLNSYKIQHQINTDINQKYFNTWLLEDNKIREKLIKKYEQSIRHYHYSLKII